MSKSQSGQGRTPPGASGPLGRQPTAGKNKDAPTTRRRDKEKENEEVIRQLKAICSPGDPNQIYRSLQKIGQGYVVVQLSASSRWGRELTSPVPPVVSTPVTTSRVFPSPSSR